MQVKELIQQDFLLSYIGKSVILDYDYAYSIGYNESTWSNDRLTIDISTDGLVDQVHFKAEDMSDKIILKVAELPEVAAKAFISFGEITSGIPGAAALRPGEECIKARIEISQPQTVLTTTFDPLSNREIQQVNKTIQKHAGSSSLHVDVQQSRKAVKDKASFKITKQSLDNLKEDGLSEEILDKFVSLKDRFFETESVFLKSIEQKIGKDQIDSYKEQILQYTEDKTNHANACKIGICYRPAEVYDLVLYSKSIEYDRISLLLPAKNKIVEIPINRAAFVEKTTTIDFDGGLLKRVEITKPSEVLEIVSLPVDILKAIVAIPAELIQLKIDTTNKEKDLIEAQRNHIETQKKLLEAQELLRKKQKQLQEDEKGQNGDSELNGITDG